MAGVRISLTTITTSMPRAATTISYCSKIYSCTMQLYVKTAYTNLVATQMYLSFHSSSPLQRGEGSCVEAWQCGSFHVHAHQEEDHHGH